MRFHLGAGTVLGIANSIRVKPKAQPADIRHCIEESFRRDAVLDAGRVTVNVAAGGRVELGGRLHSWREREATEHAAWAAPGVTAVEDRIAVG